jgi:hypothetical protein
MKKLAFVGIGLALLMVLALATNSAGALQEKPKYAIKEVMREAHKTGLYKKVGEGKASDAEEKQLVEYYTALTQNTPPKGDLKAWRDKTTKMLELAKGVAKDDKEAGAKLVKEVNCKACHAMFRD